MASFMRDQDIDTQLDDVSEVELSDDEEDDSRNEWKETPQDDISEMSRKSRKRKASTELIQDKPAKKTCNIQLFSTPPTSPVRKAKRSRSICSSPSKKQSTPKKEDFSLSTANLRGVTVRKTYPPKNSPKAYMSHKKNKWEVTDSPGKNNMNDILKAQDNSINDVDQVSDSENIDRNNTPRKNKNKQALVQDDIASNYDDSSINSSPSRKSSIYNSTQFQLSSDKSETFLDKELSVTLTRAVLHPDSSSENEQNVSDNSRGQLKKKLSLKLKRQVKNNELPSTPSRKSNRISTIPEVKENTDDMEVDNEEIYINLTPESRKGFDKDENKHAEDERRKNISTPKRKTSDRNDNRRSISKLNTGSPNVACSPKVATPLQRRSITVTTPISNKRKGRTLLTPGMAKREGSGVGVGGGGASEDALVATRRQLHVSTVPSMLPCREEEFEHVKSFLTKKIEHTAGGCMYISGVPGTGKTATVHAVIRYLQEEVDNDDLPDFDFVEINGLRLTEPKQAYVRILQALTDQKLTPEQAQQMLNKRFSRKSKKPTVILVDELDYLCNKRQDVVYNILEWPSSGGGGVVVVAISNTMDLPERALKGRVTSRMGLTRLSFRPYTHKQLQLIVSQRLADHPEAFHPDAVQFVARKVAAVSGDARRALDICRRTTELVQNGEQVTASHVERALSQIFSGPRVSVIRRLCRLAQLVLRALRDTAERTGVEETTVAQMYKHLVNICQLEGCDMPSPGAVLSTCVSLAGLGLVVGEKRRPDLTRKLCLNVSSDDIHYALDKNSGDR